MAIDQANAYTVWRSRRLGGADFSQASLDVFSIYDNLGDGLTNAEKVVMAVYVDNEIADGNHVLKDNETIYSLSGNNSLVDYVGETMSTLVNAPTHSINGYTFDGSTNYINSNFAPSSDGVNFIKDDAQGAVFIKTAAQGNYAFSSFSTANTGYLALHNLLLGEISLLVNNLNAGGSISENWQNETLYSGTRQAAAVQYMYKNGVRGVLNTQVSTAISQKSVFVGARNNNDTPIGFLDGTISSIMLGGSIGFDQSAYNSNLRTLLTSLGTI